MEKLAAVRKTDPSNLIEFPDFAYHKGSVLGKGSYGKVYSGWMKLSHEEIAVKVIKAEFYENDAKVRENLYREIDIQDDLKECRHVVRLYCRLERPEALYLVMEKCDYDLQHHLNAVKALNEAATKDFLFQLGSGIEYMHLRGIVHRDLKPANVLLVRDGSGGVVVKLADFGFARHFRKGEGTKPMDMTSLAGTPVFMAPEALECVFYKGKHYDEKVDMWSIGAVLYQCLVGRPAFYAQLQDILPILKKKGDAIAFKRGRSGQIQYIKELPSDVDSRLCKRFKMQMNVLLRQLLQVSPSKRLSYDEFFSFVDQLNRTPLDVYCPSTGGKYTISVAIETPCDEIGVLLASASGIAPADQILFDLDSGILIDVLSQQLLAGDVLQKTDQWTFIVLSKKQLSSDDQPVMDEDYVHSLVKILDEPGTAIGVVQAEGLSVMCAEVVESANEIRQVVTAALACYRKVVEDSQHLLYDVRTELRLQRARFQHGSSALINVAEEDLSRGVETGQVSAVKESILREQLLAMRNKYMSLITELERVETELSASYESMMIEDDIQSLSAVRDDLSPLLEECRRISHFKGPLLISSTKALVNQCQQKQTAFLRTTHAKFRALFNYAYTIPRYGNRVGDLSTRCGTSFEEIKQMRQRFCADLFQEISQCGGQEVDGVTTAPVAAPRHHRPSSTVAAGSDSAGTSPGGSHPLGVPMTKVSIADDESDGGQQAEQQSDLVEKNQQLTLDKNQLLRRVDELEQQLHAVQTSGAAGSIWEMIGSTELTMDQVTGTFPTNALPRNTAMDTHMMTGGFPYPANADRTLVPGVSANQRSPTPTAGTSPSATLSPPRLQPNPRDELDLEATRLSLSQLLGLTQKLQEIVSFQQSADDNEPGSASASPSRGVSACAAAAGGGGLMDTWRAATDVSGFSMLSEGKLIDSIKTMVNLSNFIETDALKAAVRDMAKQISYKNFTTGQVVLFLAVAKKGIYAAFHDKSASRTSGVRYFLKCNTIVPDDKAHWLLGTLKSGPKLEKANDTRSAYGQPKYSSYYVMEARIFLSGDNI